MVNNLDARQNDILSMINTNLERIAIALENVDMKKNNNDICDPKGRSFRECYGCKHLIKQYDIATMTNYYGCDYYNTAIVNVDPYCKNKET